MLRPPVFRFSRTTSHSDTNGLGETWRNTKFLFVLWKWKSLSCVQLFVTPWTMQSVEFSRLEYWSGEHFLFPGDFPKPGLPHCRLILYQLSHKEAHLWQTHNQYNTQLWSQKGFLLNLGTIQGLLVSLLLFSIVLEILAIAVKQTKKSIQIGEEEVQLSLFVDTMTV